ncbi:MAG: hypothetical protein KAS32_06515 [Candidatus Peribacteraceae bacterium]|nr:hypothetical protein [Candidatus Peribacteraceae bacterium]
MFKAGKQYLHINGDITTIIEIEQVTPNNVAIATSGSFGDMGPFTMTFDATTGKGIGDYTHTEIVKINKKSLVQSYGFRFFNIKDNWLCFDPNGDPDGFAVSGTESEVINEAFDYLVLPKLS